MRLRSAAVLLLASVLVSGSLPSPAPARAAAGDIGYEGRSFSGTSTPTGTKRAESVLWWNDGSWWAHMWDTTTQDFHIFRLDRTTQTWVDTGVVTETRANTHADVLWDGSHLYIASHGFVGDTSSAVSGTPAHLFRFSYDPGAKRYAPDTGFPAVINNYRTETLVIDKDSTGILWATWQQGNKIYLNRTTGDDRTWGTPFVLPVTGSSVTVDDTSAVVAFGGNKIGVMWSNATSSTSDGMYFAVHEDGQPDTTWLPSRTAIQGPETSDDHINLKSLQADSGGRVFAAVKTSFNNDSQPLIMLLVRDPASGDWTSHTIARVSECPNRPIVVIDEENRVLHAYYTAPAPPQFECASDGAIYEKTTSLDAIAFPTGRGTAVMVDADSPNVHNVSSSKQNANSATGIALLAVNTDTSRYWHQYQPLAPTSTPAAPVAAFSATPTSGTAPISVRFTDQSTGTPTNWSWSFGDGTSSTAQHPTHTYTATGTYTVSLTATNATGADTETRVGYINVTAPVAPTADFAASPTSGTTPLAVQFTDQSTGAPASWAWDFGDGSSSTAQHPSHTYTAAGTYAVTLTVGNATGTDTEARPGFITASPPPPDFSLSVSPTSRSVVRGGATTYTVTVTPQDGFASNVDLTVSGLPSGAVGTFSPNPLNPTTGFTSVLTVSTTSSAKNGNFTFSISGTSGSLRHTVAASLQIKRK